MTGKTQEWHVLFCLKGTFTLEPQYPLHHCNRPASGLSPFSVGGVLDDNHFPVFKHALERQANYFHVFQNRCHTDLVVSRASNAGNMRLLAVYGSGMTTWEIPALSLFPSK